MSIDFSPLKGTVNHLALQFASYAFVVVILTFILVFLLKIIRVPRFLVRPIACLGALYIAYKVFMIMFS